MTSSKSFSSYSLTNEHLSLFTKASEFLTCGDVNNTFAVNLRTSKWSIIRHKFYLACCVTVFKIGVKRFYFSFVCSVVFYELFSGRNVFVGCPLFLCVNNVNVTTTTRSFSLHIFYKLHQSIFSLIKEVSLIYRHLPFVRSSINMYCFFKDHQFLKEFDNARTEK